MWFLSPAHYTLNTLCSTRQAVFQELLIQLLLFDHSNNGTRRKSFSGGQAHSFPAVPMVLLVLSDTTKVLNFQGSVSGELQPAFSTCARGSPFSVQVLQSQRHLPTCTCCARLGCLLLIPPWKPLEPSSPLQPWAPHVPQQSSPVPQVHFLYGIRYKIAMLSVLQGYAFSGGHSGWGITWSYKLLLMTPQGFAGMDVASPILSSYRERGLTELNPVTAYQSRKTTHPCGSSKLNLQKAYSKG